MSHAHPTVSTTRLRWSGRTDRGKVRRNNEDSFLGLQFDAREIHHLGKVGEAPMAEMDFVFAVSDGMGGALAGEFASKLTIEKITALLPRSFHLTARGWQTGFADVLTELFDRVHRSLRFVGGSYAECSGMEATLSLCWFTPGWMYFGHIGDSRIYLLPAREGGIRQLSHDDTYVGWLLRNGKITEYEARIHPRRNVLQKALGGGNQFTEPQVGAVAYEPGDIFLLCTDGLTEGLVDERLLDITRPIDQPQSTFNPAQDLVQQSLENDGKDNITALAVQVL
jgi:protein phosphatase